MKMLGSSIIGRRRRMRLALVARIRSIDWTWLRD
jgi:hypothetical protein